MSPGTASISLYALTPKTSARPGLTGRISPGKPCFCRKRCGREVVRFSSDGGADQRDSFGLEQGVEQAHGAEYTRRMLHRRSFLAASAATFALPAHAQAPWPSKPIKLVVPYAPGGSTDVVGRVIAEYLGQRLGQNIVVENRPGKGATHRHVAGRQGGARRLHAARCPTSRPSRSRRRSTATSTTIRSATSPTSRWPRSIPACWWSIRASRRKTLADYVAYAKANPDKLAFATSGPGSSNHILGTMLGLVSDTKLVHIPYRGAGPAMQDVIAGNVPSMFDSLPSAAPHIKAGKVRALAVSGERAQPELPRRADHEGVRAIPTLVSYSWFGLSGPAKLPAPIVERLAARDAGRAEEPRRDQALAGDRRRIEHHDARRIHRLREDRAGKSDRRREGFRRQAWRMRRKP